MTVHDPLSILKKYYGYTSFRKGQEEIVEATLAGQDTLVLMPTGGGKSICFQIPALIMEGTAIVVSPLIALMNDQVLALNANGIPAVAIHSNQDEIINQENLHRASKKEIKLMYISPERLLADIDLISSKIKVSLVAIDEAHCISQWGHDFRPVYTSLRCVKERFRSSPVMALTATADRITRADISDALGLENPFRWIGSFDRPNISLQVINDPGKKRRLNIIASLIEKYHMDSGIVYCLSRKKTEDMHRSLSEMGFRSVCYHAGMPAAEREKAQHAFVNGDAQVVCATIAFGMGIDKSNIRWVVHNNIPGNIESYYQEIGRGGRDGAPAEAILFYNFADIMMRRNFVETSGQREINSEKLDFMQRYAEASVCRRRILLSYFSEEMTHDCGNCDNCRYPRHKFDGTIIAQKAISAIIRVNSQESINTIIDILRASTRADIIAKGYHLIKTYGAGRNLSSLEWHSYILQMIQLGLIEIAYEENFHLRPTPYGMKVVKGLERIELATFHGFSHGTSNRRDVPVAKISISPEERLLENLKKLRKTIADRDNVPAYVVFSDATLLEMANKKPTDLESFSVISGVGEVKLARYGKDFIGEIRKSKGIKKNLPVGSSQLESLLLYNSGMAPGEIASLRKLQAATVYGHLCGWIDEDKLTDFQRLISSEQYDLVMAIFEKDAGNAYTILSEVHNIPSYIVRTALAIHRYKERHKQ